MAAKLPSCKGRSTLGSVVAEVGDRVHMLQDHSEVGVKRGTIGTIVAFPKDMVDVVEVRFPIGSGFFRTWELDVVARIPSDGRAENTPTQSYNRAGPVRVSRKTHPLVAAEVVNLAAEMLSRFSCELDLEPAEAKRIVQQQWASSAERQTAGCQVGIGAMQATRTAAQTMLGNSRIDDDTLHLLQVEHLQAEAYRPSRVHMLAAIGSCTEREDVVNWLEEMLGDLNLREWGDSILHLTVFLLDRFCIASQAPGKVPPPVVWGALSIVSKFTGAILPIEELLLKALTFVTMHDIAHAEVMLLATLGYHINTPTPLDLMNSCVELLSDVDKTSVRDCAGQILRCCLHDAMFYHSRPYVILATAALYAALLQKAPLNHHARHMVLSIVGTMKVSIPEVPEESQMSCEPALSEEMPWADVIQEINDGSSELAAQIHPVEAQQLVHEQLASAVETLIGNGIALHRGPCGDDRNENQEHDVEASAVGLHRVMVLSLTKNIHKDIEHVLLQSAPAQSLVRKNVDVCPPWANGAKVFVENLGIGSVEEARACFGNRIGLGPQHVVINESDEPLIMEALRRLPWVQRPTLKPIGGRLKVPSDDDSSWFHCSAWEEYSIPETLQEEDCVIDNGWTKLPETFGCQIIEKATFLTFVPQIENEDVPCSARSI